MKNSINDGYTEAGIISPLRGIHTGLRIKWRPMTNEQKADFAEAAVQLKGRKWIQLQAAIIVRHLVEWNEKDGDEIAPINAARVVQLKPRLFDHVFDIISGSKPADEPEGSPEDLSAEAMDLLKAVETGNPASSIKEERLRGN